MHDPRNARNRGGTRANLVLIGFLMVGGFYLVTEHRAHLFGILPYLLLLLCPVMHMFMHGGHGHGHGDASKGSTGKPSQNIDSARERSGGGWS